jgi:hypothetical protein
MLAQAIAVTAGLILAFMLGWLFGTRREPRAPLPPVVWASLIVVVGLVAGLIAQQMLPRYDWNDRGQVLDRWTGARR